MSIQPNDLGFPFLRTSLALWAIYVAIVFSFGWFKANENARDRREMNERQAQYKQLQHERDAESNRLTSRLRELNGKPGSQRQLETELNGDRPFDSNPNDSANPYIWRDPKYGFTILFNFRDGIQSSSIGPSRADDPLSVIPQLNPPYRNSVSESDRKLLGRTCGYAWLACIGAWFLVPLQRFLSVQLSLAAALTAGMAWLVNPGYSLEMPGILHNEDLYLASLMLFASIYLLSATLVELKARGVALPLIRFGLRELLATIVVVSLVLFAGPIGYITLLVAVVSGSIFAIMNLIHRRWNPFRTQPAPV